MYQFLLEKSDKQCKTKVEPKSTTYDIKQEKDVKTLHMKIEYLENEISRKDIELNNFVCNMKNIIRQLSKVELIECNICYEPRTRFIKHDQCKNEICIDCIVKSGKMICPYCRGDLTHILDDEDISLVRYIESKDDEIRSLKYEIMAQRYALRINGIH